MGPVLTFQTLSSITFIREKVITGEGYIIDDNENVIEKRIGTFKISKVLNNIIGVIM